MLAVWSGSPQKAGNLRDEATRVGSRGVGESPPPLGIEEPPSRHCEPIWHESSERRAQSSGRSHRAGDIDTALNSLGRA